MIKKPRRLVKSEYTIFSKNLQKVMKDKSISQIELSKQLGVPSSTVNNWLHKASAPQDILLVQKLAEFLNVRFDWLLTGKAEVSSKSIEDYFDSTPEALFSGVFRISAQRLKLKEDK